MDPSYFAQKQKKMLQALSRKQSVPSENPSPPMQNSSNPMPIKLSQPINSFAFDLMTVASSDTKKNLFLSPFSIATVLGMTYLGSNGATTKELAALLCLPEGASDGDVCAAFKKILTRFAPDIKDKTAPKLNLANGVWADNSQAPSPAYTKLVDEVFEGKFTATNFVKHAEPARLQINDWVSGKTNKRITELLDQGMITADTRMVLVNALHFDAKFDSKFKKSATQESVPFHMDASTTKPCTMMHQTHNFPHVEKELFDYIELPYVSEWMSLQLVVPKEVDGLDAVMKGLTASSFAALHDEATSNSSISLSLPKFEVCGGGSIKPVLQAMGMELSFTVEADFKKMLAEQPVDGLYFSDVVHKTFVKVDEEGTEAVAATAGTMSRECCVRFIAPRTPKVVKVDRPSFLSITDHKTGVHLFVGKLLTPQ